MLPAGELLRAGAGHQAPVACAGLPHQEAFGELQDDNLFSLSRSRDWTVRQRKRSYESQRERDASSDKILAFYDVALNR
jgi:hypothetical protein